MSNEVIEETKEEEKSEVNNETTEVVEPIKAPKENRKQKELEKAPEEEKKVDPVGAKEPISFRDFLAIHKKLWPAVDMKRGTPGHTQLMRQWNSLAILFPEKCKDVVVWADPQDPKLFDNDLNIPEIIKSLV